MDDPLLADRPYLAGAGDLPAHMRIGSWLERLIVSRTLKPWDKLPSEVDEGVVQRTVQPTVPVRVDYSLTEKGKDLHRAVRALAEWADYWMPEESDWTVSTKAERDRTHPTARVARGNGRRS
jgi:DNA-binding HxlR family transcriptional regulator